MSEGCQSLTTFAIRSFGQGDETMLVVNGGPGLSNSYMLPGFAFLADRYKCVFYDQPGCGNDHTDPRTVTADSTADHFVDLLIDLSSGRKVILLTHSWGSHVLFRGMSRHPDISKLIAKAILLNPTPTNSDHYTRVGSALQARVAPHDLTAIGDLMKSAKISAGNEIMQIALPAYTGSTRRLPVLDFDYSLAVFNSVNATIGNFDFANLTGRSPFDIYVVGGADDYIKPTNLDAILSAARESAFINDAGHFVFAEAPEQFQKTLMRFLSHT
ncbi:MAG: alpha/beta hydrolase [Acidobacteriia bacterium]|nr:alpha/beta hydrolase [Terriglobia bacterium]